MFIGSLDTKALYPSLNISQSAQICEDRILGSDLHVDGVDYHWATRYLALTMTQEDINRRRLHKLVPRKRSKTGQRPTIRTWDKEESNVRWVYHKHKTPEKLTPLDKKRVLAREFGVMVETTMRNHLYKCLSWSSPRLSWAY